MCMINSASLTSDSVSKTNGTNLLFTKHSTIGLG